MWLSGPWRTRRRDTGWAADGEGNGVTRGEQRKKREARKTVNKRKVAGEGLAGSSLCSHTFLRLVCTNQRETSQFYHNCSWLCGPIGFVASLE